MRAYLVRFILDRQVVGFFAAENIDQLHELVDECTDVALCEYREIGPGGVYWPGHSETIPFRPEGTLAEDEDPFALSEAELSDGWYYELLACVKEESDESEPEWEPLNLLAAIMPQGEA